MTKTYAAGLLFLALFTGSVWAGAREDALAAYERDDCATALKIIKSLAAKSDAWAQYALGFSFRRNKCVPMNHGEAYKWFTLAANQKYSAAQYELGSLYSLGYGVEKNHHEAVKWYRLAADQGYPAAQYTLGSRYDDGRGVLQNYIEAVKWYRLAAEQGYGWAQHSLGYKYFFGKVVVQDKVRAHMWLNLAASVSFTDVSGDLNEALKKDWRNDRDQVAEELTSKQLAEAQKLATECHARNFKNCD